MINKIESLISKNHDYYKQTSCSRGLSTIRHTLYTFGAYAFAYTYIEAAFYASWIFSGLLSSLPHSVHSGGITRRPTTLLVTEIALPRLLMGKGTRGIHRGFIEETVILEERWNLTRLACAKVQLKCAKMQISSWYKRLGNSLLERISTLSALFSTRTIQLDNADLE